MGENELDLELVKRVQRGDKTAFDVLVLKYQHRIGAVIGRFVHDYAECQDIAQESFIRAYRAIGNFRGDSEFYTWLYRIAVNTAKNHLVVMPDAKIDDCIRNMVTSCYGCAGQRCMASSAIVAVGEKVYDDVCAKFIAASKKGLDDKAAMEAVNGALYNYSNEAYSTFEKAVAMRLVP